MFIILVHRSSYRHHTPHQRPPKNTTPTPAPRSFLRRPPKHHTHTGDVPSSTTTARRQQHHVDNPSQIWCLNRH
ncbi:hypothetical protein Hanom_Chr12g01136851 [Helianthus anomalus]